MLDLFGACTGMPIIWDFAQKSGCSEGWVIMSLETSRKRNLQAQKRYRDRQKEKLGGLEDQMAVLTNRISELQTVHDSLEARNKSLQRFSELQEASDSREPSASGSNENNEVGIHERWKFQGSRRLLCNIRLRLCLYPYLQCNTISYGEVGGKKHQACFKSNHPSWHLRCNRAWVLLISFKMTLPIWECVLVDSQNTDVPLNSDKKWL